MRPFERSSPRAVVTAVTLVVAVAAAGVGITAWRGGGGAASALPRALLPTELVRTSRAGEALPFRFERFDAPTLAELGRRERLDAVASDARTEFERILLVKDWVAAQWAKSLPDPSPPWNALVILDMIRSGKTGGFCAQYAQVLVQSLAYLGLTARYVEIGSADNPYRHYPVEAWSNEYDKWVLLDPDFNLHFERAGVPLSALEVHRALLDGAAHTLTVVPGRVRQGHGDPFDYPQKTAELYYYLRFHLKADHLSNPADAFNRFDDMVEWTDERTVPWESSPVPADFPKERLTRRATSREEEAYPKLNQVRIVVRGSRGEVVRLDFRHNVLGFKEYEISTEASEGWRPHPDVRYQWRLRPGENVLRVRGKNIQGVVGPAAVARVVYGRSA